MKRAAPRIRASNRPAQFRVHKTRLWIRFAFKIFLMGKKVKRKAMRALGMAPRKGSPDMMKVPNVTRVDAERAVNKIDRGLEF